MAPPTPRSSPADDAAPTAPPTTPPPAEPRQRWRLTYARPAPPDPSAVGREYAAAWEAAMLASGLPLVVTDAGRPRIAFAAPLPVGIGGRAELADVWLAERLPAWRVREALEPVLPAGHRLVDLEDIWLGAPALPGRVTAADYTVTLDGSEPPRIAAAAGQLLAAVSLPRERPKGGTVRTYDLRPLVADLEVEPDGPPVTLRLRTRIHPELGSGRPDEVLAALGDLAGAPLDVAEIVRDRIVLGD